MSLLVLKKHLQILSRASSVQELAVHCGVEPSMIRQLLQHWLRKGAVKRIGKTNSCGTRCHKCLPDTIEMYEWIHAAE